MTPPTSTATKPKGNMKDNQQVDLESLTAEEKKRQYLEVGEWVAEQIVKNKGSLMKIPPLLYAYYQGWLVYCQAGFYSKLYEDHFKNS